MEGDKGVTSQETLGPSVGSNATSITSINSLTKDKHKSWQSFEDTTELKIKAGYAEYYVLNKSDEKIYSAVLSYDERSCWYDLLCCVKPEFGFIPHQSLYPNPPSVDYKRHPLNISGFGVQVYDLENCDVMRFHRPPHNVKNLNLDENMAIGGPHGGLLGSVGVPRSKGGDYYEVYDGNGQVLYEIPPRIKDDLKRHVFEVMQVNDASGEETTKVALICIEGKHDIHISVTNMERIPAGDFQVHYIHDLQPKYKAIILAAAFFIRIREFSSYIPMIEAVIASKAIIHV